MRPTLALAAVDRLAEPHRNGHTCYGRWYNPNAGTRSPCSDLASLRLLREQIEKLAAQVHEAAHHTPTAERVAEAMTGLVMDELGEEDREGWTLTARMAIEGLAAELDRDPEREALIARSRARLNEAGMMVPPDVTGDPSA